MTTRRAATLLLLFVGLLPSCGQAEFYGDTDKLFGRHQPDQPSQPAPDQTPDPDATPPTDGPLDDDGTKKPIDDDDDHVGPTGPTKPCKHPDQAQMPTQHQGPNPCHKEVP